MLIVGLASSGLLRRAMTTSEIVMTSPQATWAQAMATAGDISITLSIRSSAAHDRALLALRNRPRAVKTRRRARDARRSSVS